MVEIRKPDFTASIDITKIKEITCQLDKDIFDERQQLVHPQQVIHDTKRDKWAHNLSCTIITTDGEKGILFFKKEFEGFGIKNNKLLISGSLNIDDLGIA